MGRHIEDFRIDNYMKEACDAVYAFLESEGYGYVEFDGEPVFKKGKGVVKAPIFFKFSISENIIRMETWIKNAITPGVYIGEFGTKGMVGAAVRGPWKKIIKRIEDIFCQVGQRIAVYEDAEVDDISQSMPQVSQSNSVKCPSCGATLEPGTSFCAGCGQNVVQQNNIDRNVSKKEWYKNYAPKRVKNDIRNSALSCYIFAGIKLILCIILNPIGIIDAVVLGLLGLGLQLRRKYVYPILFIIVVLFELGLSSREGGSTSGGYVLASFMFPAIWGIISVNKMNKQYKLFQKSRQQKEEH